MKQFAIVLIAVALTLAYGPFSEFSSAQTKPNIVFIMADDLGPGWVDFDGSNPEINTPNLQRLAQTGMVFSKAYAAATVCSPTRAACITGMSPAQIGLTTHVPGKANNERKGPEGSPDGAESLKYLPLDSPSYARELKKLGYRTGFIGKWHLAGEGSVKTKDGIINSDWHPEHYGFDSNIGGCAYGQPKSWFDPYSNATIPNRKKGEYLTDRLGEEAASFIKANHAKPFHLTLWPYSVHTPIRAPKDLVKKNGGKKYNAMLESLDNAVGRVIQALEETGTRDNTLLIFYSDNGGHIPTTWLADKKGSLLEGGLRVPMVVSWPGVIEEGSTCDQPVTSMDFFPTFVRAAGGSTASFKQLEGLDLKPLFEGSGKLDRDALYWHFPHNRVEVTHYMGGTILQDDWKFYHGYGLIEDALYNLKDDPMEQSNVLISNPELGENLRLKHDSWLKNVSAKMPKQNVKGFARQRGEVLELGKMTAAPAYVDADGFDHKDNIRPIYFNGLDYEGKPTKVFAWLGVPKKAKGKVPGIVLVHGGGGTAFRTWVQKWNEKGFAAIAIAHEGQVERRDENRKWEKHDWAGPWRRGHYKDVDKPLADQWMYHAVADTILANSLLRSLPEVDAEHVGVMGVSWGGVITSTVMGIDSRFDFAIPTYGCGKMADAENHWGKALGTNSFYREVWDPLHYLPAANMPAMWFSWPEDHHFPLDSQAASYRAMGGDYMVSLQPGMKHSTAASWNPPDSYAFARGVVDDAQPWCRQVQSQLNDGSLEVGFTSSKPLDRAVLISTTATGFTGSRKWVESPADLKATGQQWMATAKLPNATTACFLNVYAGDLTVSSEYLEVRPDQINLDQNNSTSTKPSPNSSAKATARDSWEKLVGKRFIKRPEFAYIDNDPALPNVLIYGDSISIAYTQRVREKCSGKANVYRIYSNGQHSGAFVSKMKKMHDMMRDQPLVDPWTFDWDVIHFNVGLHDLKYLSGKKLDKENGKQVSSIQSYQKNMKEIVAYLTQLAPAAKLIFATTTPVPEGADGRFAGDAQKYNSAAMEVLLKHPNIKTNDLFTFTEPNLANWSVKPGDVHYNAAGRTAQGDEVARVILDGLKKK